MTLAGTDNLATVGIIYPGEMGAALGGILRGDGFRVVTTVAQRSDRTRSLSRAAGLEELATLADVVRVADIIVSVVSPSAAVPVAQAVPAASAGLSKRVYMDVNAVAPGTAAAIAQIVSGAGFDYVDGAVNGLAASLLTGSILYLSGPRSQEVAQLLGQRLKVQVVGSVPGRAKVLKGALAGLSKGLTALFVELDLQARAAGVAEFFEERCRQFYPGVMEVVERMLPTYPRHARRRAEEMNELAQASAALGLDAPMIRAAAEVTRALAEARLTPAPEGCPWTWTRVLAALQGQETLKKNDK